MSMCEANPVLDPWMGICTAQWSTSLQWAIGSKKKFKKTIGRRWSLRSLEKGVIYLGTWGEDWTEAGDRVGTLLSSLGHILFLFSFQKQTQSVKDVSWKIIQQGQGLR